MANPTRKRAETGFLSHSLVIGTIAGTKVRLHWTFLAYLAWLGIAFLANGGLDAALSGLTLMLAVFACVVAHEFGHILAARRYGISAPDVTLLPIGGLARLQRMPERPGQELVVALAGPAVNLAIAALLVLVFGIALGGAGHLAAPATAGILPTLATINVFLALFNLLPAFPMDGGRAARAGLAMFLDREKATRIAVGLGHSVAIGMALYGLLIGHVMLIFIAIFIYFAATAEAQDVQLQGLAEHMAAGDAMITSAAPLRRESTLAEAVDLLLHSGQRQFPVLDEAGQLAGVLTHEGLIRGLRETGTSLPVSQAMQTDLTVISAESSLSDAIALLDSAAEPVVVVRDGRFAGFLTREALAELLLVSQINTRAGSSASARVPGGRRATS